MGPAFSQCTGCSAPVLAALRDNGWDTVKKVRNNHVVILFIYLLFLPLCTNRVLESKIF